MTPSLFLAVRREADRDGILLVGDVERFFGMMLSFVLTEDQSRPEGRPVVVVVVVPSFVGDLPNPFIVAVVCVKKNQLLAWSVDDEFSEV